MTFKLTEYRREHLIPLMDQASNIANKKVYVEDGLAAFLETQHGYTGLIDGKPMVCGGVLKLWEGRGYVWTVFNEEAKHCFVPIFRGISRVLKTELLRYRRLEMAVPANFEVGHRRAKLLGFKVECALAEQYLPGGEDCVLYSMLRGK